jgi:hypothetical protein
MRRLMSNSLLMALATAALLFLPSPGSVCAEAGCVPLWTNGFTFYTGYFSSNQGADISFSATSQPLGSVSGLRQQYALKGIPLEVIIPIKGSGPMGLVVGAGYSVSFNEPSQEVVPVSGLASLTRTWTAQPQIGNVQMALTMDLYPSFSALVGFRYENFQTNFVNASSGLTTASGVSDSADFALSAYIPQLGLIYHSPTQINGPGVQLGVIGFPLVLGSVNYREAVVGGFTIGGTTVHGFQGYNTFREGYYVSAFGDVTRNAVGPIQLGAFVKFDVMDAVSNLNLGDQNRSLPDVTYRFELQKRVWSVGGRLSVVF